MAAHLKTETKCFRHAGDTFPLIQPSKTSSVASTPDWRLASFSVILPLPQDALLSTHEASSKPQRFLSPHGPWRPGRYAGVRGFEHKPGDQPSFAHHPHAKRRFRNGVNAAIAAPVIDRDGASDLDKAEWEGNAVYHRVDFEPHTDDHARSSCRNCPSNDADARTAPFEYILPSSDDRMFPGSVQLRCVELAQFADRLDDKSSVVTSFLIIHFTAENLSSAELESVSRSLTRPRNKVVASEPRCTTGVEFSGRAPLRGAVDEAKRLLISGGLNPTFMLAQGGYLQRQRTQKSSDRVNVGAAAPSQTRRSARPMRVTCAIPWHDAVSPPPPEEFLKDHSDSTWSVFDAWGWALSTGADRFYEAIPARTATARDRQMLGQHEYWTLWGTAYGLSIVRKPGGYWYEEDTRSGFMKDPSLWMLAHTRFVDLCLLTQRCTVALHELENSLELDDGSDLEGQLRSFDKLQTRFLTFRNHLWFDVVSDHLLDSRVLKSFRKLSGLLSMYTDLRDEIEIRREIYDTRHAIYSEKDRTKREENREKLNMAIGIAAVILAVPAVAETTGVTPTWGYFGIVVGIMALLSLTIVGIYLVRKSKAPKPSTSEFAHWTDDRAAERFKADDRPSS